MATLHIGNNRTAEMAGDLTALGPVERLASGCGAQRALWFARDGDVLVLPRELDADYVRYVTALTGVRSRSVRIIAAAAGYAGPDLLTEDRLADPALRDEVREALGGRAPERVFAFYPDASVVALARSLGAEQAVPGHAFLAQGGSTSANSKALFRAVAAGIAIPIAQGAVAASRPEADEAINGLLDAGHPAIVKLEFQSGSYGNEILSPTGGLEPYGARRVEVLADAAAVREYLDRRWDWLTDSGRRRLVVERYYVGARPIYAEFLVSDECVRYTGQGELLMAPVFDGVVIPVPGLAPDDLGVLVDSCRSLCEAFRAFGYRGTMSVDGFVTRDGEVLLNETNSRVSGSTHLHDVIGPRIVGRPHLGRRVLFERGGWAVPSFGEAAELLSESGLAYDPETRAGVILVCDFTTVDGTVRYCVVAENITAAREIERKLPS
jgi:hypothetical protein